MGCANDRRSYLLRPRDDPAYRGLPPRPYLFARAYRIWSAVERQVPSDLISHSRPAEYPCGASEERPPDSTHVRPFVAQAVQHPGDSAKPPSNACPYLARITPAREPASDPSRKRAASVMPTIAWLRSLVTCRPMPRYAVMFLPKNLGQHPAWLQPASRFSHRHHEWVRFAPLAASNRVRLTRRIDVIRACRFNLFGPFPGFRALRLMVFVRGDKPATRTRRDRAAPFSTALVSVPNQT